MSGSRRARSYEGVVGWGLRLQGSNGAFGVE